MDSLKKVYDNLLTWICADCLAAALIYYIAATNGVITTPAEGAVIVGLSSMLAKPVSKFVIEQIDLIRQS